MTKDSFMFYMIVSSDDLLPGQVLSRSLKNLMHGNVQMIVDSEKNECSLPWLVKHSHFLLSKLLFCESGVNRR